MYSVVSGAGESCVRSVASSPLPLSPVLCPAKIARPLDFLVVVMAGKKAAF